MIFGVRGQECMEKVLSLRSPKSGDGVKVIKIKPKIVKKKSKKDKKGNKSR